VINYSSPQAKMKTCALLGLQSINNPQGIDNPRLGFQVG